MRLLSNTLGHQGLQLRWGDPRKGFYEAGPNLFADLRKRLWQQGLGLGHQLFDVLQSACDDVGELAALAGARGLKRVDGLLGECMNPGL